MNGKRNNFAEASEEKCIAKQECEIDVKEV